MIASQPTHEMPADQFTAKLAAVCGQYDFQFAAEHPRLWGGVKQVPLAGWDVAMVATNLHSATKTASHIRQDDCDSVFLIVQQFGQSVLAQNQRKIRLLPGDMMLIDSRQPSNFSFNGQRSMQISLHVSRTELIQRFGQSFVGGLALRGSDLTARSITALLGQVCNASGDDANDDRTCDKGPRARLQKETLLGLLGLFLLEGQQSDLVTERTGDGALWALAQRAIADTFQDPAVTGENIARRLGVSLRSLQRCFTARNTTFRHELLNARLEYAREMLGSAGALPTISAIALTAGFSDISYFSRRFREAYGCSPRAYMQGAHANVAQLL